MEARLVLEPRLAALKLTINDLAQVEGYLRHSREAGSTVEYEHGDSLLHSAVAKVNKNPLLYSMFQLVNNTRQEDVWGRLKEASLTLQRRELYYLQHEELVVALRDRDAQKAEKVMREHIEMIRKHLLNEE
jgi:DNA-binding FadR family transcriptional regulator